MRRNYWIALCVFFAAFLWMLSGCVSSGEKTVRKPKLEVKSSVMKVKAKLSQAQSITQEIKISGRTYPDRRVFVHAQIAGEVQEIHANRGDFLKAGDVIVKLDPRDLPEQIAQARATLRQRELEHDASKRLVDKQLQSETREAQSLASLEAARASLKGLELALEDTIIKAPFSGYLQDRPVEIGDYLAKGAQVAHVLDLDPIIVEVHLAEARITKIHKGSPAKATINEGPVLNGSLRYIAPEADEDARTFRVEMEAPNTESALLSGKTASVVIETDQVKAHLVSPAHLSLNTAGVIGLKVLDESNVVQFIPVTFAKSDGDDFWVTDVPDNLKIITLGQGFVRKGDIVEATFEDQS